MSASIISQLLNRKQGTNIADKKKKGKKRAQASRRMTQLSPPSLASKANNPLQANEWVIEKKARRQEVKDEYFQHKKQLYLQEQYARQRLKDHLRQKKEEVTSKYRVHSLPASDPRFKKARQLAEKKFTKIKRKMEQQHRQQWQAQYRKLKNQRNKQYRGITKMLKREHRRDQNLPDEMKTP